MYLDETEFYDFYGTPCRDVNALRTRSLWRAVILQAVLDAKSKSLRPEYTRARRMALAWFGTSDFNDVCDLADWDPEHVLDMIRTAQRRNFVWRKPNGQGWRAKRKLKQKKSQGDE